MVHAACARLWGQAVFLVAVPAASCSGAASGCVWRACLNSAGARPALACSWKPPIGISCGDTAGALASCDHEREGEVRLGGQVGEQLAYG